MDCLDNCLPFSESYMTSFNPILAPFPTLTMPTPKISRKQIPGGAQLRILLHYISDEAAPVTLISSVVHFRSGRDPFGIQPWAAF